MRRAAKNGLTLVVIVALKVWVRLATTIEDSSPPAPADSQKSEHNPLLDVAPAAFWHDLEDEARRDG